MKNKILFKLAGKNLVANKFLEFPFVISTAAMSALFFVMSSLINNEYVKTRHSQLVFLMGFGVVTVFILFSIFVLYANNFLIKRRNKEFALYGVLGLGKKHMATMIFVEQFLKFVIISVIAVFGGYLLGKLIFLFGNILLRDKNISFDKYPFEITSVIWTVSLIAFNMFISYIWSLLKISVSSPVTLMQMKNAGEKEPKVKGFIVIIGTVLTAIGYYIAVTTHGSVYSLQNFFIAIFFVIAGTYGLFVSMSIFVLKILKRNDNKFYKPERFIFVSRMLYRMKSNAVGLASISILCSGIIVVLATTLTIYAGAEEYIGRSMPRENKITSYVSLSETDKTDYVTDKIDYIREVENYIAEAIKLSIDEDEKIRDFIYGTRTSFFAHEDEKGFYKINEEAMQKMISDIKKFEFVDIYTQDEYNMYSEKKLMLNENQIAIRTAIDFDNDKINIMNKEYEIVRVNDILEKPISDDINSSIIVRDFKTLIEIAEYYSEKNKNDVLEIVYFWDVENQKEDYKMRAKEIVVNFSKNEDNAGTIIKYEDRASISDELYQFNGGFILLGIIIGIVFLTAITLVLYYKQISEASEDKRSYAIMKKIGLSDELIKKTADKQLVWLFFLPLAVALFHMAGAFKILSQLLKLFAIMDRTLFLKNILIITLLFGAIYFFVFKITSKVYNDIANRES